MQSLDGWARRPLMATSKPPFLLVGTADQISAQLAKLAEMGVRCLTVFEESADALLPFVSARE